MKKLRLISAGLVFILAFAFILHAQETTTSDFDVELQALEATTPTPYSQLPDISETHGFYSAQNPDWPPAPADVLSVPAWPLGDGFFAMDDLNVNYAELAQAAQPKTTSSSQLKSKNNFSPDFLITPANIGFSISQQATNIVLKWQSTSNRIYMVEQRPTLTSSSYWTELTNYVLSASTTNITSLVLTNLIRQQPIDFSASLTLRRLRATISFRLTRTVPLTNWTFFKTTLIRMVIQSSFQTSFLRVMAAFHIHWMPRHFNTLLPPVTMALTLFNTA